MLGSLTGKYMANLHVSSCLAMQKALKDGKTGVIIPIHRRKCTIIRGTSILGLPRTMCTKCLEKRGPKITEPKPEDTYSSFHAGRSIADEIFTIKKTSETSWEYAKDDYTYFAKVQY